MTTHHKKFWPLRSVANGIVSLSVLIAAIGVIIGSALRAQTIIITTVIDPHIDSIARSVFDTCHSKSVLEQDTVNCAVLGLIKEIRLEQKREAYIRDETVSPAALSRANAAFKRDSIRGERYK